MVFLGAAKQDATPEERRTPMRRADLREHAQIYASARPKIVIDGQRNRVFKSRVGAPDHVVDVDGAAHPLVCEEDLHTFDKLQPVFDDMTYAFAHVALLTGGDAPPARLLDSPHSLRRTVSISGIQKRVIEKKRAIPNALKQQDVLLYLLTESDRNDLDAYAERLGVRPAITQDEPEEPVDDAFDFEEPMDESEDQETPVIVARAVPPLVAAAVPPPLPHLEDGPAAGDDPAADAALAAAIERLARHGDGDGALDVSLLQVDDDDFDDV